MKPFRKNLINKLPETKEIGKQNRINVDDVGEIIRNKI